MHPLSIALYHRSTLNESPAGTVNGPVRIHIHPPIYSLRERKRITGLLGEDGFNAFSVNIWIQLYISLSL
jgi:hypothetical protein